jgi:hypothetical protein
MLLFFSYIDQGKNPQLYTKDCMEKALGKNEAVKGKIDAYKVCIHSNSNRVEPRLADTEKPSPKLIFCNKFDLCTGHFSIKDSKGPKGVLVKDTECHYITKLLIACVLGTPDL